MCATTHHPHVSLSQVSLRLCLSDLVWKDRHDNIPVLFHDDRDVVGHREIFVALDEIAGLVRRTLSHLFDEFIIGCLNRFTIISHGEDGPNPRQTHQKGHIPIVTIHLEGEGVPDFLWQIVGGATWEGSLPVPIANLADNGIVMVVAVASAVALFATSDPTPFAASSSIAFGARYDTALVSWLGVEGTVTVARTDDQFAVNHTESCVHRTLPLVGVTTT